MSAIESEPGSAGAAAPANSTPVLRTLVLADLVGSTALTESLGDQRAIEVFRKHDRMGRDLVARHGGREIDKTDGFLVLFDRPIRAIAFALDYQRALRTLGRGERVPLSARVGIHVGDVLVWENTAEDVAQGAKLVEVEGLVKPIAARLMGLARPAQILMTGVANTLAQRGLRELGERVESARFKFHGRYRFKGVADAIPVYEVGEPGIAPLKRPRSGDKAWRELPWWRRPKALALELAAIAVVATLAIWFATHAEPAIAFAARDWVVVGDLRNLTGEKSFDDSLEAALRISLEQSKFVNVVSDLQVRDALKRMTKPPDTPIDRTVGSEIAQRESARALIIPTVAEVGGRLRISAEVVDPRTQTTVYAQSADGSGAGSALDSVDKVARELRGKLGEALKSIEGDSVPLPKVTTENLDALRAYALGWRANIEGRLADALPLYEEATRLDPGFALAHMGRARIHFASDNREEAHRHLQRALAHRERLPAREQLYLDAWIATFGSPKDALEKWKLVGAVYPDYFWAHSNYALFALSFANRYEDAREAASRATSPHNPFRRSAHYLLGVINLGLERYSESLAEFHTAEGLGVGGSLLAYADAYAAQRQFDQALAIIAKSKSTGVAGNDISDRIFDITLPVDQGRWQSAMTAAGAVSRDAQGVGPLYGRIFDLLESSLWTAARNPGASARLATALQTEGLSLARESDLDRSYAGFAVATIGYLSARGGDGTLARKAIAIGEAEIPRLGFPNAESMLALAKAELARLSGKPDEALKRAQLLIDGNELYQTHVVLMEGYADKGDDEQALVQARWLSGHRGRAYIEKAGNNVLQALNIADSNLALLRGAELAKRAGRSDQSRGFAQQFRAAWPDSANVPFVAQRVAALDL